MLNLQTKIARNMKKKFWNIIPGQDGSATLLLYGDVGEGRSVDSSWVVTQLNQLENSYRKIDVRINSKGGEVFSGIAIYNALRNSKADITIFVDGVAASIAAIIALCGKPLYMSPYSKIMLHAVSGGTYGNASDLRQMADQMESIQADLAKMIAGRCGMKAEDVVKKYFDEKDHWMSAKEAVDMKLADGIYKMEDDSDSVPQTEEDIYNFFNQYTVFGSGIKNKEEMALIDDIKTIPSFANVADANGILAQIKELENKATKVDALTQANNSLTARIADLEKKEVENFLNQAVKDGKIREDQKESFGKLMNSDRETTEALINAMKPAQKQTPRIVDDIHPEGDTGLENKSWDELDKENMLSTLKAQNISLFSAKFKEKFGVDYQE